MNDDDGAVRFEGEAPFHLPVAQSTAATGHGGNGVTATFYAILPDRGPRPQPVEIQMTTETAIALSGQLAAAARDAD